jgi:hypothetical protein
MDTGQDNSSWSPDIILSSFDMMVFAWPVPDRTERFSLPEAVYLEVPVRPPIGL